MTYLYDSNVLILALNGHKQAGELLLSDVRPSISLIVWMEVMAGAKSEVAERTRHFLSRFHICEINLKIAERAVELRREMRLKLPDALIYATALVDGYVLATYNTRDFPLGTASIFNP